MTPKELADKQAKVIFDDDKVLFIKVNGYDAMEYYGPERMTKQYSSLVGYGDLYLIIDKEGENNYFIQLPRYSSIRLFDFDGMAVNFDDVTEEYPQLETELINLTGGENIYQRLLSIKSGKELDRWDLRSVDDTVSGIKFNKEKPGKSMIMLHFDPEEYVKFFEYEDGESDKSVLTTIYGSGYYGGGFYDSDSAYYDWKEGYILRNISNENEKLLEQILKLVSPEILKFTKDDDKYWEMASNFLYEFFGSQTSDIKDKYSELKTEWVEEKIRSEVEPIVDNIFLRYGILKKRSLSMYATTVDMLLNLLRRYNLKNGTILELFQEMGSQIETGVGNFYEMMHEGNFDDKKFNEQVKTSFEDILEEIDNNPERFETFRGYSEVLEKLDKLGYEIGKQYPLPNDPKKIFRIDDVTKDTYKIVLVHWDGSKGTRKSYSFEEFVNYLQTPELFENLIRKLRRFV